MFLREKKILLREVFRADILEYDTGIGEYRLQGLVVFRMKILVSAVTFRRQFRAELEDTTSMGNWVIFRAISFASCWKRGVVPCGAFILDVPVIVLAGDNNINISILDLD